ncbi:DNA-3-methyladenine glycosylase I [Pseudomonadota bacterium]
MKSEKTRCQWPGADELMIQYHDKEWGVPVYDDTLLFEFLILEGAQAGLSWRTVLYKRERYREVFAGFDIDRVARYSDKKVEKLLQDPGIIRNRLKINAAINNARCAQRVRKEHGSLSNYLWSFVDGRPIINAWRTKDQVPASTVESDAMSKALKKAGFKFVGTTICYAFMQAVGMVNDHMVDCFCYRHLAAKKGRGVQ